MERTRKIHAKPINPTPVVIGIAFVALAGIGLYAVFQEPATPSRKPSRQPSETQPAVFAPKPAAPEATEPKTPEDTVFQPEDQPAPAKAAPEPVTVEAAQDRGMATADGLAVVASNGNFGDPAPGTPKQLRTEYTLDGEQTAKTVRENETLAIGSGQTQPAVSTLAATVGLAEVEWAKPAMTTALSRANLDPVARTPGFAPSGG